jgi:3-oxoacyl-ACP reductase-like protein
METGIFTVLLGKPEGWRPLGRPQRRWEDNIKMDLQEVGCGDMDWVAGSFEYSNEPSGSIKCEEFID